MAPLVRKVLFALFASVSLAPSASAITESDVQAAYGTLMGYYNESVGLWIPSTGLTVVADLAAIDREISEESISVFSNTFFKAQKYNLQMQKTTYVNAIANELFLDVAAHLANRAFRKSYYLDWAQREWAWFQGSGMINSESTINDGLDLDTCENNGGTVWSYNQGVILGGLTKLSRATGDDSYITKAKEIADAAIAALTQDGILHDACDPDCGGDGSQFKGIFARNLQILQKASPEERYASFLDANADSIWEHNREGSELSLIWSGPFITPANASTQSSAMDALIGALEWGQDALVVEGEKHLKSPLSAF
ncbi:hypothetical protein KC351_g10751 [Hortaea werneckii]|nr:hypothetical protein KC351_g10751 [Hortaea werneckii]